MNIQVMTPTTITLKVLGAFEDVSETTNYHQPTTKHF